jgi:hypothetical protein
LRRAISGPQSHAVDYPRVLNRPQANYMIVVIDILDYVDDHTRFPMRASMSDF